MTNDGNICRGRFIAPTADLPALGASINLQIILLMFIIAPTADVSALLGCPHLSIISLMTILGPRCLLKRSK
jgi:hypothetical protein